MFKCSHCQKTTPTEHGMKCHKVRVHKLQAKNATETSFDHSHYGIINESLDDNHNIDIRITIRRNGIIDFTQDEDEGPTSRKKKLEG